VHVSGRLQGKTAVVTGAASGIGAAIAELFALEGANVVSTDVDSAGLEAKVAALAGDAARHSHHVHDVSNEADWVRVLDAVVASHGRLDVLVNNAGIAAEGAIEDVTLDSWRQVMAINLDGTFLGCKHAVQRMKLAGGGIIVNVSSVGALKASLTGPAYGASKAAVLNLSRTVALSCARRGLAIRCNSLHPGLTRTPMMARASPDMIARLQAGIPMGRLAEPADIARAAVFLASEDSSYVTGTSLVVDGGYIA
jgi:3(or 17)beta-hydroxysteroid dehydrogenase